MKKIIHVDMDCFYAQVEMRDNPLLKNIPLAIGGLPGTRSVLCTSNYIARKFGVKSAMPTDYALKLCPGLKVITPNFTKYTEVSEIINALFHKYSSTVESISLDEAFLDVSHCENAGQLAMDIKNDILSSTGLTASVGVAPNKFLAKIASDWKKPNGHFVIRPNEVENFIKPLPVKLIPGVGKKGYELLEALGIKTCEELRRVPHETLHQFFGKFSYNLALYAQGIDERNVEGNTERKSLSVESTFLNDLINEEEIKLELRSLFEEMGQRLIEHLKIEEHRSIKKIFVKVKFNDFTKTSCEETLRSIDLNALCPEQFYPLLKHCLQKKGNAVRLIGLGVRFVCAHELNPIQLSFLPLCG